MDCTLRETSQKNIIKNLIEGNPNLIIDIHTHILPENMPDWSEKFGRPEYVKTVHDHSRCCAKMI